MSSGGEGRGRGGRKSGRAAERGRGGKARATSSAKATAAPPKQVSKEELAKRELKKKEELAVHEQKKLQIAEEKKKALREKERADRTQKVNESISLLQGILDATAAYKLSRDQFAVAENLKTARLEFTQKKKTLKSDLKKCTTLVKKVKTGTLFSASNSTPADVIQDVASLNLSRYVEEVVAAILESRPKVAEIPMVSALCAAMHARYAEFLPNLLPQMWNIVLPSSSSGKKSAESPAELSKLRRFYVRLFTDFMANGLLPHTDELKLQKCVADWTGAGSNYQVSDAVAVVAFCRSAGFELLGISSVSTLTAVSLINSESSKSETDSVVVSRTLLDKAMDVVHKTEPILREKGSSCADSLLTQHCLGAYQTLSQSLVQTHIKLQKLEKRCEQDRLLSGTLSAGREKGLTDARKLCESLQKSVEALSDCLNQIVPTLIMEEDDDDARLAGAGVEVWTKDEKGQEHLGPFDDEETRAFYCDIPDLLTTIPRALLGISEEEMELRKLENAKKYGAGQEDAAAENDDDSLDFDPDTVEEFVGDEEGDELDVDEEDVGDKELDDQENQDTPHYRFMLLLEQELPECNRREQIDEITEKFCTNHGSSKNSRKRLLKTLFLVPRSRLDLLPYYSRMAATLDRVWNDISPTLVNDLEQQFHGQAKFKKNQNTDSRMRTARYIGELTKFRAAPPIVALRCIQRCIEDFTGSNVDIACCILETCGRYLYRMKHTNAKLTTLMDTMTRLGKAKNLDERSQSLLKAAFFSVKPPPSGPRKKAKAYPALESYLRYLLLARLEASEQSISFVSKQIVRLPWGDQSQQCGALVCKLMLKACRKGRYRAIEAVAAVAGKLRTQRAAGEVTIRLIDAVIEELNWALQYPNFRDQQRIITYARLIGELYRSSQITAHVVIEQLYTFLNTGHEIPESLQEASKRLALASVETANTEGEDTPTPLPVYNSSNGVPQAIQEDEEMTDSELKTNVEDSDEVPKPMAVSAYSKYDPRVPSLKDPPNSSYRITLVCTLLEVAGKSLLSRNNMPRVKGFLAAFQRYLFTKTALPTDVEFALLDTFDIIDSQWKRVSRGHGRGGAEKEGSQELGFPRYATWLDAHVATVKVEEIEAVFEIQKRSRLEAHDGEERSMQDEDMHSIEEDDAVSLQSKESALTDANEDGTVDHDSAADEEDLAHSWTSEEDEDDEDNEDSEISDGETDDDENDEFDEETYLHQLEEEAFERELRRVTMDALEKGKNMSRKQVGDSMISGSQTIKKKPADQKLEGVAPHTGVALGGEVGISFQVLKKGNKGKVEAKELYVPVDTNLAHVATMQDDKAAKERDVIKQRVLHYEAQSAEAEMSGSGNVYLDQEKLQRNRNKPLSMEEIDKNFGTSGGNLHPSQVDKKHGAPTGQGSGPRGGGRGRGRGGSGGRGRGGRSNSGGRTLFGL